MESLEDDEVFVDDDGLELPLVLRDKNLKEWMLVNVLTRISNSINWKIEGSQEFIDQVNYYLEFDTFRRWKKTARDISSWSRCRRSNGKLELRAEFEAKLHEAVEKLHARMDAQHHQTIAIQVAIFLALIALFAQR